VKPRFHGLPDPNPDFDRLFASPRKPAGLMRSLMADARVPRQLVDRVFSLQTQIRTQGDRGAWVEGCSGLLLNSGMPREVRERALGALAQTEALVGLIALGPHDPDFYALVSTLQDEKVRSALAKDPHLPKDLLIFLFALKDVRLNRLLLESPALTAERRWEVARAPFAPAQIAEKLPPAVGMDLETMLLIARCKGPAKERLARENGLPPAVYEALVEDLSDFKVFGSIHRHTAIALARNAQAPPSVLSKLLGLADAEIRRFVEANLSAGTLLGPSNPKDIGSALATIRNPSTPRQLIEPALRYLAACTQTEALLGAASHPGCPQPELARLARDPDPQVRAALLLHPRGQAARLDACASSTNGFERLMALLHPGVAAEHLKVRSEWVECFAVARHPSTSASVLQELEAQIHPLVHEALQLRRSAAPA